MLRALEHPGPRPAVLLIDEIDRADDDFEAFLLELLAEAAVTIPELGTIRAEFPPVIVLTSNRTRDLHDAVKRRCLYQWLDYPSKARELDIVRRRVGGVSDGLAHKVVAAVAVMRDSDIQKPPGIAEAIDWLRALDAARRDRARRDDDRAHARLRPQVRRGPGTDPRRWPGEPAVIAELAAAFGRRLHEAGLPVTPERSARFADALSLTEPVARTRLYWVARAVFVSDHAQVKAFDRVFFEIFGGETFTYDAPPDEVHELAVADDRPASANAAGGAPGGASPAPGDGESSRRRRVGRARDGERRGAPARQALRRARARRARRALPADERARGGGADPAHAPGEA